MLHQVCNMNPSYLGQFFTLKMICCLKSGALPPPILLWNLATKASKNCNEMCALFTHYQLLNVLKLKKRVQQFTVLVISKLSKSHSIQTSEQLNS